MKILYEDTQSFVIGMDSTRCPCHLTIWSFFLVYVDIGFPRTNSFFALL